MVDIYMKQGKGNKLRLIGDLHGYYDEYLNIIKDCDYSVQLGDFGFEYDVLDNVDSSRNTFITGNHDNYDELEKNPRSHNLGDFGIWHSPIGDIFFIRGEFSVDKDWRLNREKFTGRKTWWKQEELTYAQGVECLALYEKAKPSFVISHGCPEQILPIVVTNDWKIKPSITTQLLGQMYDIHNPKLWVFAHHHQNKIMQMCETTFVCVNELCYIDVCEDLTFSGFGGTSVNYPNR